MNLPFQIIKMVLKILENLEDKRNTVLSDFREDLEDSREQKLSDFRDDLEDTRDVELRL